MLPRDVAAVPRGNSALVARTAKELVSTPTVTTVPPLQVVVTDTILSRQALLDLMLRGDGS